MEYVIAIILILSFIACIIYILRGSNLMITMLIMATLWTILAIIGKYACGAEDSREICMAFQAAFDFPYRPGAGSSDFSSSRLEIKKRSGRGTHGHLAVETNCLPCAVAEMRRRGIALDETSWTCNEKKEPMAVFLRDEIGGFAVHLMQK